MKTQNEVRFDPTRLLPAGWIVAVLVAISAYVAKPEDELGFAIVVGGFAALMAYLTFQSATRAVTIVSLVLGVLWTLLFSGFTVANFSRDDDVQLLVRIADVVAIVGGAMIIAGALGRLRVPRGAGA